MTETKKTKNSEDKSLQDLFLAAMMRDNIRCVLYTTNGVQVHGTIKRYDAFTVLMEDDKQHENLIYKHAISTVSPVKHVEI